jgi:hypothetical protein
MQFLSLSDAVSQSFSSQFRYPLLMPLVGLVVVDTAFVAATVIGVRQWTVGSWSGALLLGWLALWTGIFGLVLLKVLRGRLGPANWLVRLQRNGILTKYRSYLNPGLPSSDPVAVFIPFAEVEWIRAHYSWQNLPGSHPGDDEQHRLKFAEICLRSGADREGLKERLAAERQTQGPKRKTWYGSSQTLMRHHPVSLSAEGLLRIQWDVRPGLKDFLAGMKGHVTVAPDVKTELDYRSLSTAERKIQEDRVLELLSTGDRVGALRVVKHLYGFDTTRAIQFLEELGGKE